jgi:hypothetical protein
MLHIFCHIYIKAIDMRIRLNTHFHKMDENVWWLSSNNILVMLSLRHNCRINGMI